LKQNKEEKVTKAKSCAFKPFHLIREKNSKERKTQSFYYTPVVSNLEKKNSEKNGKNSNKFSKTINEFEELFNLQTESRGVKKRLSFEMEIKKLEKLEETNRNFKALVLPNYSEMVYFITYHFTLIFSKIYKLFIKS